MERQSTSKLFRALIAVVAFFVLCTSSILFASCAGDPLECEHEYTEVVGITRETCGTNGTVTYKCPKCDAEITVVATIASGEHTFQNGECTKCHAKEGEKGGITMQAVKSDLTSILEKLNTLAGKTDLDDLAKKEDVNALSGKIVDALSNDQNFTIPGLEELLQEIKDSLGSLGDLELELTADTDSKVTLADAIQKIYNDVHKLYTGFYGVAGESGTKGLYELLVGGTGETAHVHNWVLELKKGTTYSCTTPNTYVWGCSFCDETKGEEVTVMATGHATEFKTGLTADGHHYDATCITPERVEGYCANCKQYTGEWTEVGQPTYKHKYVLETGENVKGEAGTAGSCTSVHQNVYHCETCGGAYVEETTGSSNGEHNYYFMLNEDGTKRPMTDEEKLKVWNDNHTDKATSLDSLTAKQVQELNGLLDDNLNIVYWSDPTCVDPSLIVVECMECGVRYAYTFGEPNGHTFTIKSKNVDATCLKDGCDPYYYCDHCGYYFMFEDKPVFDAEWGKDGKAFSEDTLTGTDNTTTLFKAFLDRHRYTRKYLESLPDADGKTEVLNSKGLTGAQLTAMEQKAYDVATAKAAALGHDYVVVYTNTFSCVTERTYILVCQRCFHDEKGNGFAKLVKDTTGAATKTYFVTEDKKANTYILEALNGDNTDQANLDAAIKAVTALTALDDKSGTTAANLCDLTKEYNEMFAVKSGEYVKTQKEQLSWLIKHGYLVRDAGDDEIWGSLTPANLDGKDKTNEPAATKDLTDAELTALVDKFNASQTTGDFDFATLYKAQNVIYGQVKDEATSTATSTKYKPAPAFVNPVTGHSFTDYAETVIGNCVMYERHVYFCAKCGTGEDTLKPSPAKGEPANHNQHYVSGKGPFNVTGVADTDLAKFDTAEEAESKTDLRKSWEKVYDPASEENDGNAMFVWLIKYGYLNDYRTNLKNDWSKVDPSNYSEAMSNDALANELTIVLQRFSAANPDASEDLTKVAAFFTEENVLGEFTVTKKYTATGDTEIKLGHKFEVVKHLEEEVCDEPGYYVYVCSQCGNTAAWGEDGTYDASTVPALNKLAQLTFFSVSQIVETGLPMVDKDKYKPLSDENLYELAVPAERRGTTYDGDYGTKIDNNDLQAEWEALVGTSDSTAVKEEKQLNWLLEKGYLNNLIDTYLMDHLEASDARVGITTEDYKTAKAALYDGGALKSDVKAAVLAAAKALATEKGYSDYNAFYLQSGDSYKTDGKDLIGEAANKTNDAAATEIPLAGHYYAKEGGELLNLEADPLCGGYEVGKDGKVTDKLVGFASKVLTQFYKEHKIVCWVDDLDSNTAKNQSGWQVVGTFDPADLDPEFKAQADEFGIIAACRREKCPQHTIAYTGTYSSGSQEDVAEGWKDKIDTPFTAGYVAAQDHKLSYQKYKSDDNGYPTNKVEELEGGDHVFYNLKEWNEYLPAGVVATAPEVVEGETTLATPQQKTAAQAAMDADLLNLYTLQKIWNALFIPAEWQAENKEAYPVLAAVKAEGGDVALTGTIDWAKLEAAFSAYNDGEGPAYLWKGEKHVSAWRPISDEGQPSCWVSRRCEWYGKEYKTDINTLDAGAAVDAQLTKGIKNTYTCTYKYPDNSHDWPKLGDFGFDTHVANCQHKDLCDTCGKEIGTDGQHNLIDVTTLSGNNQAAWLEVLKHKDQFAWLADIVNIDANGNGTELENWKDWEFIEGTCYTGEENPEDGEQDHIVYFCTGELEVIYNLVVNGNSTWDEVVGSGKAVQLHTSDKKADITWSENEDKTVKSGTSATVNYYVEDVHPEHKFVRKYFYLTEEGKIDLTREIPADVWNDGWTDVKCMQGYAEADVCVNCRRDGETLCGHVYNSKVDNDYEYYCYVPNPDFVSTKPESDTNAKYIKTETACHDVIEHPSAGHFLAPVLNYWTYKGKYVEPTAEMNAKLDQVCTICGENFYGEYANTTDNVHTDRDQYNLASGKQINEWNAHWEAESNPDVTKFAQLIRAQDVTKLTEAPAGTPNSELFEQGVNVFRGEANKVEMQPNANPGYDPSKPDETGPQYWGTSRGNISGDVTIVVGKDKTDGSKGKLTFGKAAANVTNGSLAIGGGDITFVGEGAADTTVDFSALDEISLIGVANITFDNITVELGENALENWLPSGSTLTFRNAIVKSASTPVTMLSTNNDSNVKVVIENSTLITTGENEVGFASWLKNAEVVATNSTFVGTAAGAWIRGGKATFTECVFVTKAGTKGPGVKDGSNLPDDTSAALVVGNPNTYPSENYGDANVTLNNCTFGTYSDEYSAAKEPVACTAEDPAIKAYSSNVNNTTLTLDAKSYINALQIVKEGYTSGETSTLKVVIPPVTAASLGETVTEQKEKAVELVKSLAAKGGEVALPENLSFDLTESLTIGSGIEVSLDIGNGSTVNLKQGLNISEGGKLTIEGEGILNVGKRDGSKNNGILVYGEGSNLTLNGAEITVADTTTGSTTAATTGPLYAISAEQGATVNVNNSLVYNTFGMALSTANDKGSGTFVLVNSAFVSDMKTSAAEADGGVYALLINEPNSSIYAGGCMFYGTTGAAFIRSAKEAVFAGCTFISGAAKLDDTQTWSTGTEVAAKAIGAIVVGNGDNDAYGSVNVEFIDGDVYFAKTPAQTAVQGKPSATTVNEYTFDAEKKEIVKTGKRTGGWYYPESATATTSLVANTKLFTVSALNNNSVTINFSDEDTAKNFLGANLALEKDVNLFLEGTATLEQINVTYSYEIPSEDPEGDPELGTKKIQPIVKVTEDNAEEQLTDAVANGGKIVFPTTVKEGGYTIETEFEVNDSASIELHGNTLKASGGFTVVNDGESQKGELTISGGDVEANINVQKDGDLTLSDVELKGDIVLGYETRPTEKSGANVTITGTTIVGNEEPSSAPIYVNGVVDGATLTLEDSVFLGSAGLGLWIAGQTEIIAKNCVFYGSVAAVEVCSGKATFDHCEFATTGEDLFYNSGTEVSWFYMGGNSFPSKTKANLVINSKGGGYDSPVEVTVKGTTKFHVAKLDDEKTGKVAKVFTVGKASGNKTTQLSNTDYWYQNDTANQVEKISVAVVCPDLTKLTTALVKLTLTNVSVGFQLDKNVFVYDTTGDATAKTPAQQNTTCTLTNVQKAINITGAEFLNRA